MQVYARCAVEGSGGVEAFFFVGFQRFSPRIFRSFVFRVLWEAFCMI